jgi:hypothetical protein
MQQIFGFPVFIKNIDKKLYDKEQIIKDIEYNYKKDKNRNAWDKNTLNQSYLHHGYNDWNNENFKKINFDKLINVYKNVFTEFFKKLKLNKDIKFKFEIINYTCLTSSQNMESHSHADCDFSSIHYIKFDETIHTSTLFENDNNFASFSEFIRPNLKNILNKNDILNSWYYKSFRLNMKEDDICITPGIISHSITKQLKTNKKRISIVTNITLE